jgi:hypothetical protein
MRAIALLSGFKFRNGLRTLFTDPRKLIPLIIFIAIDVKNSRSPYASVSKSIHSL